MLGVAPVDVVHLGRDLAAAARGELDDDVVAAPAGGVVHVDDHPVGVHTVVAQRPRGQEVGYDAPVTKSVNAMNSVATTDAPIRSARGLRPRGGRCRRGPRLGSGRRVRGCPGLAPLPALPINSMKS